MPKYIIHIGPPKSGSKFIQSQLFHSRDYLESKGILYPDIWWKRPDKIMHDSVRDDLKAGKDLKGDFDRLNSSGAETIILSCEGFDGLNLSEVERLKEYIGDNPADVVYYARRWSDRIPSDWRQRVMMGHSVTFPEFYIRLLSNPEGTGEVNYSIVWDRFSKIFGRGSLRIVSFNNLKDRGVDFFQHFCEEIIGIPGPPPIEQGLIQQNVGPNMIDAELLRDMNYLYYVERAKTDPSIRIKFDKLKQDYALEVLREHMKTDMRRIKLKDNAVTLRTTWDAVSAYKDRLVSPKYGQDVFERRDVDVEFVGQNYLFRQGVLDELTKLYEFLKSAEVRTYELEGLE